MQDKFLNHIIELIRFLYNTQDANGDSDWFSIAPGVCHGCILSSYLFDIQRVSKKNGASENTLF